MQTPKLKSPFFTTNIHVRQSIVRENIINLNAFIWSDSHKELNYLQKDEIQKQLIAQQTLLKQIDLEITKQSQLAFHFGLPML